MPQKYLLWCVLVAIAGCTAQPRQSVPKGPRPFSISSEHTRFAVRGRLSGTIELGRAEIVVIVREGTVVSRTKDEPAIRLRPLIAGPTSGEKARRMAEFAAEPIGGFEKEVPRALGGPLTFRIPVPREFDPGKQWLVFQFQLATGNTTYACDVDNLSGPDPAGPKRSGLDCWSSR